MNSIGQKEKLASRASGIDFCLRPKPHLGALFTGDFHLHKQLFMTEVEGNAITAGII